MNTNNKSNDSNLEVISKKSNDKQGKTPLDGPKTPEIIPSPPAVDENLGKNKSEFKSGSSKIAIIIPFRDSESSKPRTKQLNKLWRKINERCKPGAPKPPPFKKRPNKSAKSNKQA